MERKEFIKQFIGIDLKTLFAWATSLFIIYAFFSINFSNLPNTIFTIIKLIGLLLAIFVGFVRVVLIISVFLNELMKLFPAKFSLLFKKYGQKILQAFVILCFAYIVYDSIKKGKYFILFFMLIYVGFSFFLRNKERA
jgi:hypothetical protein